MKKLTLFLPIFLFACAKGKSEPMTPLKAYHNLENRVVALEQASVAEKKYKSQINEDFAKLQLQIISNKQKTDAQMLGAVRGISTGIKNLFGRFASSVSMSFNFFDMRIKELEKKHQKQSKKKVKK